MGRKRSRPCAHVPGDHGDPDRCPALTSHASGLCPEHLAAQRRRVDANRPNPSQRGYGTRHQASRARDLAAGRVCAVPGCGVTDGLHREHIDGDASHNHPSNIQYLCGPHHASKTLTNDVQRDELGRIQSKWS